MKLVEKTCENFNCKNPIVFTDISAKKPKNHGSFIK